MSRAEDPTLRELECDASATGEIHSINTDSIEIRGIFTPGQALTLRPGVKVFILTADDAIDLLAAHADAAVEVVAEDIHAPKPKESAGGK
ncbi:hypothetical protein A5722_31000 [Mycobacterium vulneris]|nr:hypothetical protein A5721_27910 [Mycolicibacterium vulneris]OCB51637.1 hypothetical protein A5722_31000 [Mycolicibacterium vulneris]OCB64575.1 hypothetical protein A5729_19955 [Mycolicibacterium vulneris]